jgi:poly-gamma-glutamate capsule biosynthesis protein CapA/YwtB (metallophosphatase superfamily)
MRSSSLSTALKIGILSVIFWNPLGWVSKADPFFKFPEPPPPEFIAPELPTIIIKAVGDTILGTDYPNSQLPSNPNALFSRVHPVLQNADVVFGNFESTLTTHPTTSKTPTTGRVYAFRTPPHYAKFLQQAGFHILSVANNHSYDFTQQGFSDTIHHLEQAGMAAVGEKGKIVYTEVNGLSVAWLGFSYLGHHNSIHNLSEATTLIRQASETADIVIVSIHAGAEGRNALRVSNQTETFLGENRGNLVAFSRHAIAQGADLILGHGPHVPRALELHNGKLIAYSLGNFIGYRTLSTAGETGYSLILEVELDDQGNFARGQIHSLRLDNEGIPYPDAEGRSITLIRQLTQQDFPDTPLIIDRDGRLSF